jgi:hypothetical protein
MPPYSPRRAAAVLVLVAIACVVTVPAASPAGALNDGPSKSVVLNSKYVARHIFKTPRCRWVHVEVRRQTPNPLYVGEAMAPCHIVIRRSHYTFLRICALIVHEYGHLAGYEHSTDPDDIMFPARPARYPPCARHQVRMQRRAARARRS